MKFTLNRKHVLVTPQGPSYEFEPGVPVHVQPRHAHLAQGIGAEPHEDDRAEAAAESARVDAEAAARAARPAEILAAVQAVVAANDTSQFTAGARPKVQVISAMVGYEVSKGEIDAAMTKVTKDD